MTMEKHNILAQLTILLYQKRQIMIVLKGLDKVLSHEGTVYWNSGEFDEIEDFEDVAPYIEKCSLFGFKCLSD